MESAKYLLHDPNFGITSIITEMELEQLSHDPHINSMNLEINRIVQILVCDNLEEDVAILKSGKARGTRDYNWYFIDTDSNGKIRVYPQTWSEEGELIPIKYGSGFSYATK